MDDEQTLIKGLLESDPGPDAATDARVVDALTAAYHQEPVHGSPATTRRPSVRSNRRFEPGIGSPLTTRTKRLALVAAAAIILIAAGIALSTNSHTPGARTTPWHAARPLATTTTPSPALHGAGWQLVDDLVSTGWQQNTAGPPPGRLDCPTASACYALSGSYPSANAKAPLLGESLYVSADLGRSWSVLPIPGGFSPTTALSCASATTCYVGGTIGGKSMLLSTLDGGHQWTIIPLTGQGDLFLLSCRTVGNCIGVAVPVSALLVNGHYATNEPVTESLVHTTNGGASWTSQSLPVDHRVNSLSCATTLTCIAAGSEARLATASFEPGFVLHTTDGGAHWRTGEIPADFSFGFSVVSLSCTTASQCMAIGLTSIPNPQKCIGPNDLTPPGSDSCTTSNTSLVSAVVTTADGGATWTLRPLPADVPNPQLTNLGCASPTVCWLAGQEAVPVVIGNVHDDGSSVIVGTTDGGLHWNKVTFTVPAGAPNYDGQSYLSIGSISCPTTEACVAMGSAAQGAKSTPVYSFVSNASQ